MTITEQCAICALGNALVATPLLISFDEMLHKDLKWMTNSFNYVVVATLNPAFACGNDISLEDIDPNRAYMVFVEKDGFMKCVLFRCVRFAQKTENMFLC